MVNFVDLIGVRMLVRSNEDEPIRVGTVVGWAKVCDSEFPLVKFDGSDKECLCMSVILPYNKDLHELFDKLSPAEGWQLARNISIVTQIRTRREFLRVRSTGGYYLFSAPSSLVS